MQCCIMCLSDFLTKIYKLRPPNHNPAWSTFRDVGNLSFWGGHFEKWPKLVVSPSFFSGNIADVIPEGPMNKMVPLMDDHYMGGGRGGDEDEDPR